MFPFGLYRKSETPRLRLLDAGLGRHDGGAEVRNLSSMAKVLSGWQPACLLICRHSSLLTQAGAGIYLRRHSGAGWNPGNKARVVNGLLDFAGTELRGLSVVVIPA